MIAPALGAVERPHRSSCFLRALDQSENTVQLVDELVELVEGMHQYASSQVQGAEVEVEAGRTREARSCSSEISSVRTIPASHRPYVFIRSRSSRSISPSASSRVRLRSIARFGLPLKKRRLT